MKLQKYLTKWDRIYDRYCADVAELGEQVRTEVIIPLCRTYQLTFTSGMGSFFFTDSDNYDYIDTRSPDFPPERKKVFAPVFTLLNQELTRNDYLGFYVADVKKEDY